MSRHRNVRSMNYTDEYDYDDEYGQSVEDDYCISPSDAAQFMYDRNRQSTQISAFFNEADNIAEENEAEDSIANVRRSSETFQKPPLSELEEVRLQSCLDEIRNVIGDTIPENILIETILKHSFDLSKSLDAVLSYGSSGNPSDEPKPQRERRERNRDDDFSDPCAFLNHLTQSTEYFNICSNRQKPQHIFADRGLSMLDHANFLSSDCPGKIGSIKSVPQMTQLPMGTGTLNVNSELSSDRIMPANSNCGNQLKIQIPRFQKLRKDSNKENIAEGEESDSDEISFSSLTALAKQYSAKHVAVPLEKETGLLDTYQSEILGNVPLTQSSQNCVIPAQIIEDSETCEVDNKFARFCSDDFSTKESSAIQTYHCEHLSPDDEGHLLVHNTNTSCDSEMTEIFRQLSTQCEILPAEVQSDCTCEILPAEVRSDHTVFSFPQYDQNSECLTCTFVPLRKAKSNENTTFPAKKKNLASLTDIFMDHLHKSPSYSSSPNAVSNYDVVKSESCPQLVIPRLHLAQKRRGISETLPDDGQGEKISTSSTDAVTTDEDSESDNWVIDLKCALKNVQKEYEDGDKVDSPAKFKSWRIDSPTVDHLFVPDLPCLLDGSYSLEEDCSRSSREPSAFGKVLCRKWRQLCVKKVYCKEETGAVSEKISRFTFDTLSPDDDILRYLRWK